MKKAFFLTIVLCLFFSSNLLADTLVAVDSCRTSLNDGSVSEADTNKSDTNKLSVRGDYKAAKSWIKFNVSGLNISKMTECQLRITLYSAKSSTCLLSYVNDDCDDNISWTNANLTWNNAPGNITSSDGVNPDDPCYTLDDLQDNLDPDKTTFISTVDYSYGGLPGDQFFFDVLPILQADNDGIVQFVLHGAGGNTDFATHTTTAGADYYPILEYSLVPTCEGVGIPYSKYADVSCRTELYNGTDAQVDFNRTDSNKLTVRGDYKAMKSWIKFDIDAWNLDPDNLKSATLRITLYESKSSTCSLSAVNDDCLDNIDWGETDITWNNAPGNITSSDGVNPDDPCYTLDDLQDNLVADKTTFVSTVDYTDGAAGEQFFFDVLPIIQADTDGIVQFALHGSGGNTNFATHDSGGGEEYWPLLEVLAGLEGADDPYPCPNDVVSDSLASLSWRNPDPNGMSPITPTVYLWRDGGTVDSLTLAADSEGVSINETNFPNSYDEGNGSLYVDTYYWYVDCDDPCRSPSLIPGVEWLFHVDNNNPPEVDAGPNQTVWLGKSGTPGVEVVNLDGTTSDDGLPNPPGIYTVLWEQVDNGAPTVTIVPNNIDDPSVTFTERGDYEFSLTADDTALTASDTIRIVVGDDACDASHISIGSPYDPGDENQDCIVNLGDFAELIAKNWLDCSDTLTNCGF